MVDAYSKTFFYCGACDAEFETKQEAEDCCEDEEEELDEEDEEEKD